MVFSGLNEFSDNSHAQHVLRAEHVGCRVRVKGCGFGVLAFCGTVTDVADDGGATVIQATHSKSTNTSGNNSGQELWYGVALDAPLEGGTNGALHGRNYFNVAAAGSGVFVAARSQCVRLVTVQQLVEAGGNIRICTRCQVEVDVTCDAAENRERAIRVRCSFFDRHLHSRIPLVPTPARLMRAGVQPMVFILGVCSSYHRLATQIPSKH
jgi:hypothetical protein